MPEHLLIIKGGQRQMKFTKETCRRSLRTFLQASCGFLATTGLATFIHHDYDVTKEIVFGLVGSAVSAGIAAVMNLESGKCKDE